MMDDQELTLTLNSPFTDEDWDLITDVDFDYTSSIAFKTKHGKTVEFIKRERGKWIPMTRRYFINPDSFPYMTSKWIEATGSDEVEAMKCSKCGTVYDFTEARNWCSECGADNRGGDEG